MNSAGWHGKGQAFRQPEPLERRRRVSVSSSPRDPGPSPASGVPGLRPRRRPTSPGLGLRAEKSVRTPSPHSPSCRSRPARPRASPAWLPPRAPTPPSPPSPVEIPRSCRCHARAGWGGYGATATPQMRRRGPRSHGLRGPNRPAGQAAAPVATPSALSAAQAGAAKETRRGEQLKAGTSHSHQQNQTQRAANSGSSGRGSPAPLPHRPARGRRPRPGSQLPPQALRLRSKPQQCPPTSGPASTFPGPPWRQDSAARWKCVISQGPQE